MSKRWMLATALVLPLTGCPELEALLVEAPVPTGPAATSRPGASPAAPAQPGAAPTAPSAAGAFEEPNGGYLTIDESEVTPGQAQRKPEGAADWHLSADGRSAWRHAGPNDEATLRFTPALSHEGDYEVRAWVPEGLGDALHAIYRVYEGTEPDWVFVSQKARGGSWVKLGVYAHSAAAPLSVLQSAAGHEAVHGVTKVAMGPIKFVRLEARATGDAGAVRTVEVSTGGRQVRWEPSRRRTAIATLPHADGFALAYTDKADTLVVATLDAEGRPTGETTLAGRELLGFSPLPGGGLAALSQETAGDAPAVFVTGFSAGLGRTFETRLLGGEGRGPGRSFAAGYFGNGRLIAAGDQLAAYFEHSRNFAQAPGPENTHQGDDLFLLDASGAVEHHEAWIVSHGLDQRLAWDGAKLHQLSLGDCYPKGLVYRPAIDTERRVLFPAEAERDGFADCAGGVDAELGGLVAWADGAALTFTGRTGRDGMDVGVMRLGPDGTVRRSAWLTATPGLSEEAAKLVRLPDGRLVVLWQAGGRQTYAATLDADGRMGGEPRLIAAPLGHGDDPAVTSAGEIAWAYAKPGSPGLALVRFRP